LRRMGRLHDAELEFGPSVLVTNVLVAARPKVLRYRVANANAWAMTARLLAQDRPEESIFCFRVAARLWLDAVQRFPDAITYRSGVHGAVEDLEFFRKALPGDLAENAATPKEVDAAIGDTLFAHHARATSWFRAGAWLDSLDFATKAAQLRKNNRAYDWLYVAMCHAQLGHFDDAQTCYDKSAEEIAASKNPPAELIELRDTAKRLLAERRNGAGDVEPASDEPGNTNPH